MRGEEMFLILLAPSSTLCRASPALAGFGPSRICHEPAPDFLGLDVSPRGYEPEGELDDRNYHQWTLR